jgi:hypothetical protein
MEGGAGVHLGRSSRLFQLGFLFLTASFTTSSWGAEPYSGSSNLTPSEIQKFTSGMAQATDLSRAQPCFSETGSQIACSELADQFCEDVWSPKNEGNLDNSVGKIRYGKSSKSDLTQVRKIDLEALIQCGPRLPADLRTKVGPIQTKLKAIMKKEHDAEDWYEVLNQAENQFWDQVKAVAHARTYAKHPEIKNINETDQTIEQKSYYKTEFLDLKNQVITAKYEKHPNWLRVVRLFKDVIRDLNSEIPKWNLAPEVKTKLLEKINSVQLKLPFSDPRVLNAEDPELANCFSTVNNAFYESEHHNFTMCAGQFNSAQNDAEIYWTIAHEVGHSIDPENQASDEFMRSTVGKVVDKFCNAKGPVYSCTEWEGLKKTVLGEPSKITEPVLPFSKLTACLKSPKDLKAFEQKEIQKVADATAERDMKTFASKNEFTDLALEVEDKKGSPVKYQYFMRPDRLRAYNDGKIITQRQCTSDSSIYLEIFTQELSCDGYDAKDSNRSEKFAEALKATKAVGKAINEHWYSFCGRECSGLSAADISRDTSEDTADWIAHKVTTRFLKREPSLTKRRELATTAFTTFCRSYSEYRNAQDLISEEANYTSEESDEHPEDRKRILSIFSPEVMKIVSCSPDQSTEEASGKCEL